MEKPMTEAEILAARTSKGGWTRAQLAAWGVPWPPPQGWKQRLMRGEPSDPVEKPEFELPTVGEVAEHVLGRKPLEEEIFGEIRADDVVISYTCIRTISPQIAEQLTPPDGWL